MTLYVWSKRSLCIIANSSNARVATYEFPLWVERMTSTTMTDPDLPQWAVKPPDYSGPAIDTVQHSMMVNSFIKRPIFTLIAPVALLLTM